MSSSKEVFRGPGEGEILKAFGLDFGIRIAGSETNGAWFAFEFELARGGEVPPHIHKNEEEVIFVLEGEIKSRVGERIVNASAGSCHLVPRGTVHGQTNRGTTTARLLLVFSPPHLEGMLREASRVSDDQFPEIAAKYGMEFV